jgi:hypothetical protein
MPPESCSRDVVPTFESEQIKRQHPSAEAADSLLASESLQHLLKDDPKEEDILAVLEERAQLLDCGVIGWAALTEGE